MKIQFFSLFLALIFGLNGAMSQTNWYISQEIGDNTNTGLSAASPFATVEYAVTDFVGPGDTVIVMGVYKNLTYNDDYEFAGDIDDPQVWKIENTIKINDLNGFEDEWITFKPYNEETLLMGDASNIFRVTNSSYLRVVGFEIEGEVENISIETALALQFVYRNEGEMESMYRVEPGTSDEEIEAMTFPILEAVSRPSYTDTRGIYMSNVHHIEILNNHVHHTPGTGLRVADCDYVKIVGNELDNNSRRSYSGTHALVVTKANSFDLDNGYKIFIQKNEVHHNYNEIYSWAPSKTIITPRIDEGKGISLQRNSFDGGWTNGRFLIENNVTYWNGFSGLHSNTGARMDFINNTSYYNSYTNTITYSDDPSGKNIGMSTSNGDDIKFINNVIYIDASWGGFTVSSATTSDLEVADNLIFGVGADLVFDEDVEDIETGRIIGDPEFVDAEMFDFNLQATSPAVDAANALLAPSDDFYNQLRDDDPDRGAIEYIELDDTGWDNEEKLLFLGPYPNPFNEITRVVFNGELNNYTVKIYDLTGKLRYINRNLQNGLLEVEKSLLAPGVFILEITNQETNEQLKTTKLVVK